MFEEYIKPILFALFDSSVRFSIKNCLIIATNNLCGVNLRRISLRKEPSYAGYVISSPPDIIKKEAALKKRYSGMYLAKTVNKFISEVSKNKNFDLSLFSNNLPKLDVVFQKDMGEYFSGCFEIDETGENIITVSDNSSIYHELFHCLSALYKNKIIRIGFSYHDLISNQEIGKALNEGYTTLLARRYFKNSSKHYILETFLVSYIEAIIGKDKMEMFFSKTDLKSVIRELEAYASYDEIFCFLKKFDYISDYIHYIDNFSDFSECQRLLTEVVKFIMDAYKKKIKSDYASGRISKEHYLEKLKKIDTRFNTTFHTDYYTYHFLDNNLVRNITRNVLQMKKAN